MCRVVVCGVVCGGVVVWWCGVVCACRCGSAFSLVLTASGEVLACGDNACGQLGTGDTLARRAPCAAPAWRRANAVQLACGDAHAVALTRDDDVYACGSNARGQVRANRRAARAHTDETTRENDPVRTDDDA